MQPRRVFRYKDWIPSSAGSAFLRGVWRAFGMRELSDYYPIARSAEEGRYQDYLALKSDWEAVGKDLAWAMQKVGEALPEKTP